MNRLKAKAGLTARMRQKVIVRLRIYIAAGVVFIVALIGIFVHSGAPTGVSAHVKSAENIIQEKNKEKDSSNGVLSKEENYERMFGIGPASFSKKYDRMNIGPNPFRETVRVNYFSEDNALIEVYLMNAQGIQVTSQFFECKKGQNSISLNDLETLPNGIYYAMVMHDEKKKIIKLVKN